MSPTDLATAFNLADATDRAILADLLADAGRDDETALLRKEQIPVVISDDGRATARPYRPAEVAYGPRAVAIERTRRLRVRRVNTHHVAMRAAAVAAARGQIAVRAGHGGDVNNSYGYAADTEGVVAIADPQGHVWVSLDRLPANKVTLGGVAAACGGERLRPLLDCRYGEERTAEARAAAADILATAVASGDLYATVSLDPEAVRLARAGQFDALAAWLEACGEERLAQKVRNRGQSAKAADVLMRLI